MAARPTRRTATRGAVALACVVAVTTGALTGTGSAAPGEPTADPATGRAVTKPFRTSCPFADPVGPVAFTMSATTSLPASPEANTRATIGDFTIRTTLPRAAALALLGPDSTSLEGGMTVDLVLEQGKIHDKLAVPLTVAATELPAEGDLPLVATGKVPDFSIATAGVVRIRLSAPRIALGPVPAKPAADTVPAPQATCTTEAGQDLSLGLVVVRPAPGAAPPKAPAPEKRAQQQAPAAGSGKQHAQLKDIPPGSIPLLVTPLQPNEVLSTSTLKKTGAVVHSKPAALFDSRLVLYMDPDGNLLNEQEITGMIGFAPVTTTYLGYGFLPISATVEFLPDDYQHSKMLSVKASLIEGTLYSHLDVRARLSDVMVNGQPLDAGPACMTKTAISLDMVGPYDPFNSGGRITTDPDNPDPKYRGFTLPEFENCGVAEKLSSLFTGQNSGPGNQAYADLVLIPGCLEADHRNCPPIQPIPPAAALTGGR